MIICKRPVQPDDHLQEASPSRWSFAWGRSIQMFICKRLVDPDNHLQEAGQFRWSFARGRSIRMMICKRPVHPDDHLQETGPSLVVVCRWLLFFVGRCLSLVVVCHWLLVVVCSWLFSIFRLLGCRGKQTQGRRDAKLLKLHKLWWTVYTIYNSCFFPFV